ncbi:MAG: putative S-layer protein [Nanoarchaeota archaeon]|nr:putative S-layer protein [Nanoarchaeota archaeon]MBU1704305.1 putative S-layer protein [Nanoarchaeota archaeon]
MSIKKIMGVFTLLVISMLAFSGIASAAAQITFHDVKLDNDQLETSGTTLIQGVEKGNQLEVRVRLESNESLANVEVRAELSGYDHNDRISDVSDVFDMKANVAYTKKLSLDFPVRMEQDGYKLMIDVRNRDGAIAHEEYDLEIDTERHSLEIKDVILSPENEVVAGRSLLVSVRLKNLGESREEDVKIKVSIPELGISQSEYVDDIDAECTDDSDCDDSLTSEEIFLRIPADAETGEYDVDVEVQYDDGDESVSESTSIFVEGTDEEAAPAAEDTSKTLITIGADVQTANAGGAAVVYPITLTNQGTASKTYTVSADSADWATFTITPSNVVVLEAGESKAVYVYVSAKEGAAAGEQMFSVEIKSGDKTLKQVPLKANVAASSSASGFDKVKRGLEVGLVVLVVLLVILGLIIGFNKLKGNDDDEDKDEEGQTYY